MSLLIQSQDLHCKSPPLRIVLAQSVHGHHLQDRLISVSPDNRWTYRNVITVASSLVLGVAASKRRAIVARPNVSASALVNHSFVHRIREHYPTPQLQHRRPAPIGKTAVSDGLSLCSCFITGHRRAVNVNSKVNCSRLAPSVARQPVYSAIATVLVYIIIVNSKIARPALPPFVPLHSPCGICRLPYHISPNSYSSLPSMSYIEQKVQTSHAALEESPPDRFESVNLSATYQTHDLES
jgi:hypothetical protein